SRPWIARCGERLKRVNGASCSTEKDKIGKGPTRINAKIVHFPSTPAPKAQYRVERGLNISIKESLIDILAGGKGREGESGGDLRPLLPIRERIAQAQGTVGEAARLCG